MAYQATVLNVMIASPGDCVAERQAIRIAIGEWNAEHAQATRVVLVPRMWERDVIPGAGDPQMSIDEQIVQTADIVIALFRHTIGFTGGGAVPGTVHEIDISVDAEKPVHTYFYAGPIPPPDADRARELGQYRGALRSTVLHAEFADDADLVGKVTRNLLGEVRRMSESNPESFHLDAEQVAAIARQEAIMWSLALG